MNRAAVRKGPEELRREVEAGRRVPFYLLHGEEDFERDAACAWLAAALAPEAAREFNVEIFRGDEFALEKFLEIYQAYPLLASHRLLVLKGAEHLTGDQCRRLESLVEAPAETAVLVVVGAKVDMRRKFFQQLAKKGRVAEFRPPFETQLPQWIQRQATQRGLRLDAEALDRLRRGAGANLRELAGELDKLALFAGEGQQITGQLVDQVVGGGRAGSIFKLADAIGQRQHSSAARLLRALLDQGEEPGRILWMINRHFQLLLKAHSLVQQRLPREQLAGRLGISGYFVNEYLEQARHWPALGLWEGLGALCWADDQLKSQGRRQERAILELLLCRLCAPPRSARVDRK